MTPITYVSDNVADWEKGLDACVSLRELRMLTAEWTELCGDANKIACGLNEDEFIEFRAGLKKERRGRFAGEQWHDKYGAIIMPKILFEVGIISIRYVVPWGCAYLRLKELGKLPTLSDT